MQNTLGNAGPGSITTTKGKGKKNNVQQDMLPKRRGLIAGKDEDPEGTSTEINNDLSSNMEGSCSTINESEPPPHNTEQTPQPSHPAEFQRLPSKQDEQFGTSGLLNREKRRAPFLSILKNL